MRTIPPGSRTAIDHPAATFKACTATMVPQGPDQWLALVATTQTYLAGLANGDTPSPGEREAWDEFYRSFAPVVRRQARSRGRERSIVPDDDATQEVWLKVVERLETFRIDASLGSFPGWLRAVARRRSADRRRAAARSPFPATWDTPPVDHIGTEVDPAEACERAEDRAYLAHWLDRLRAEVSPLDYRILHLRSIEDRSAGEVGRLVGLSTGHVRVRHHRMLRRLRQLATGADRPKDEEKFGRRVTPTLISTCS